MTITLLAVAYLLRRYLRAGWIRVVPHLAGAVAFLTMSSPMDFWLWSAAAIAAAASTARAVLQARRAAASAPDDGLAALSSSQTPALAVAADPRPSSAAPTSRITATAAPARMSDARPTAPPMAPGSGPVFDRTRVRPVGSTPAAADALRRAILANTRYAAGRATAFPSPTATARADDDAIIDAILVR